MIKAECTWGDGPDVLIEIDGREDSQGYPLLEIENQGSGVGARQCPSGYIEKASVGASAKAARRLAAQLIVAAERAEELERGYIDAMRAPG